MMMSLGDLLVGGRGIRELGLHFLKIPVVLNSAEEDCPITQTGFCLC